MVPALQQREWPSGCVTDIVHASCQRRSLAVSLIADLDDLATRRQKPRELQFDLTRFAIDPALGQLPCTRHSHERFVEFCHHPWQMEGVPGCVGGALDFERHLDSHGLIIAADRVSCYESQRSLTAWAGWKLAYPEGMETEPLLSTPDAFDDQGQKTGMWTDADSHGGVMIGEYVEGHRKAGEWHVLNPDGNV